MSVNYSILANNPVWNGNTEVSAATAVATTNRTEVPIDMELGEPRTVIISNLGPTNLYLNNSVTATTGLLLQPGAAITVGVSGAALWLYNASAADAGSFVAISLG
jgi:hypothetical protein